jgi:hypothetical protein
MSLLSPSALINFASSDPGYGKNEVELPTAMN